MLINHQQIAAKERNCQQNCFRKLSFQLQLGRWVYRARDEAFAADTDNKHQTAHHVLSFFCELNKGFLQDWAAMLVYVPERFNHPMFQEMLAFQHPDFLVSSFACASLSSFGFLVS